MKHILGLDLGSNSIGWALIEVDHRKKILRIINLGARILPMDSGELSKFNNGAKIKSAAKERNESHRARITRERYLLRRDRLHLVLNLLEALPEHYKLSIEFINKDGKRSGKFVENNEPKIAYLPTKNMDNKHTFLFEDAFNEMIKDLQSVNPDIKNEKKKRIPKDWTLYYLRQKALRERISLEEFAWVLLSYNQKRGTQIVDKFEKDDESNDEKEFLDLKVVNVERKKDNKGIYFEITLNDSENTKYKEYTTEQLTFEEDIKEVIRILKKDEQGNIVKEKTTIAVNDLYNLELSKIEREETDDKKFKFRYHFIYKNGWSQTRKSAKENYGYERIKQELEEGKGYKSELYVVTTKYDAKGNPVEEPTIKLPDFNGEGSKDWTLLKNKTEKDAVKFNIANGYVNSNGSSRHYISPKIYDVIKNDVKNGTQTKIIGGLFQTIDRKFYREELTDIINTQRKFHCKTLDDKEVFEKCVKLLYPNNEKHAQMLLANKGQITNLLVEDILLYQRPLDSKKSEVTDCKFEINFWKEITDKSTGEIKEIPIYKKAVSVSHPLYQEFRIWDKIHNIRLIEIEQKEKDKPTKTNVDVTNEYFTEEAYQKLFHFFNERETVKMEQFLTFCENEFKIKVGKKDARNFVWNFPEEEEFKGNETRKSFYNRFKRCGFVGFEHFMTQQKEMELWHYLYSVSPEDRKTKCVSVEKAGRSSIQNFFKKYLGEYEISEEVFEKLCADFENYPKFESKYGSYSEKALKKLLSVMRVGDNFITKTEDSNALRKFYLDRINQILEKLPLIKWEDENCDFREVVKTEVNLKNKELPFPKGLFSTFREFTKVEDFKFLDLTKASYLLYGRHSELAHIKYWNTPEKIREGIKEELKQHSLNNPVAEKVIKEMMSLVADIWDYYGKGRENFFDEIHLEVARELQKSNKEKKEISDKQEKNRKENQRLRNILKDFLQNNPYNAKVGNQDHFERLKIVEEGAKNRSDKDFYKNLDFSQKDIKSILEKTKITKEEFEKYKLWIEQGYKSPYTGEFIKLSDLFNGDKYNIDHIFPRALVSNDSLINKVVCESFINRYKSDSTGRGFIVQKGGKENEVYDEVFGKMMKIKLLNELEYVDLVSRQFKGMKKYILLSNEVPSGFTNSQLNTTKHIARKAMELLSHIVRENGEVEFRAKRVLPVSGMITTQLKREWKLNEVWTELLTPRFKRLNELTNTSDYGEEVLSKKGHPYFEINTDFIKEKNENFELKRLDHRHHSLDALIVALCTENHVQYINNVNSGITNTSKDKMYVIKKQRESIKRKIQYSQPKKEDPTKKEWKYMLPGSFRAADSVENGKNSVVDLSWEYGFENATSYQKDYKRTILEALESCIISFKNDFKVISKTFNLYESYYDDEGNLRLDENGKPKKGLIKQKNPNNKHWAIRKPLHKDTVFGDVNLKKIKTVGFNEAFKNPKKIVEENLKNKIIELQNLRYDVKKAKKYFSEKKDVWKDLNFNKIEVFYFTKDNINPETKMPKELYFATRKELGSIFKDEKGKFKNYDKVFDIIENSITDTVIQDILKEYLKEKDNEPEKAFSPEGIEEMNKNIEKYNKGVKHKPILKVRWYEKADKFPVGQKGNRNKKYVEAAKGTNLFFAVYADEKNGRNYSTISLNEVIERQKQGLSPCPETNEKGERLLFSLSPNDLVYVPSPDEVIETIDFGNLTKEQLKRVYNVNDFSGVTIYFTPNNVASSIIPKEIDMGWNTKKQEISGSFDTKTASLDNKSIKDVCIKLKVDRLGNISKF